MCHKAMTFLKPIETVRIYSDPAALMKHLYTISSKLKDRISKNFRMYGKSMITFQKLSSFCDIDFNTKLLEFYQAELCTRN